jgi:predicted nucleic acid-binding protein
LAHRLARRENRSIADIVERALESYEVRDAGRGPAAAFYAPDGMVAAIARVNGGRLATRNLQDFRSTGLDLISPWEF